MFHVVRYKKKSPMRLLDSSCAWGVNVQPLV
nr:MAG TPA: hypothetical protein [Caudoviricetes sp.]